MKLTVLNNNIQQSAFEVENNNLFPGMEFFVGRDQECHVVLDDHKVSRHHAMLIFENFGNWKIKKISDSGSLLVNGDPVDEKSIGEKDKIQILDFELKLSDLSSNIQNDEEDKTEFISTTEIMGSESSKANDLEEKTRVLSSNEDFSVDENSINELELKDEDIQNGPDLTHEKMLSEFDESDYQLDDSSRDDINNDPIHSDYSLEDSTEKMDISESDNFEAQEQDSNQFNSESDNEFADNDFGFDSDMEGSGDKTQVFTGFAKYELKLYGENVPYTRYLLEDNKEVIIGRSEDCDIVLQDVEVSGQHAKIKKTLSVCVLEDLNSGNGTFFKGERINKAELVHGDEFVIGGTTFSVEVQSDLIEAESDSLMPVEENQVIETEEIVEEEADFDGELSELEAPKGFSLKAILADPKRKKIFYVVVFLLLVLILFDDESTNTTTSNTANNKKEEKKAPPRPKANLSKEVLEQLEQSYLLARSYFSEGRYADSIAELDKIRAVDPEYKETAALFKTAKEGLQKLQEAERKKREEEERKIRMVKVKELLEKANQAIKDRQVVLAEELFSQIYELDPENIDVASLKLELDAYKKELALKKAEEERKKQLRQEMIDQMAPGKNAYLKKDWHKAILNLERFLNSKGLDEDLVTEASDMLKEAKENLDKQVAPLLGKARAYKEGQDLKNAYQTYNKILTIEPSNSEAINEVDSIKQTLEGRSKKTFREALILYDLSLYDEAKEKFKEVLQISPINSPYYEKASRKLKEFWNE